MNQTLLELLGKSADHLPPGARTQFAWSHAPRSWQVFLFLAIAAALVYGVVWLYRREAACPARWRACLAGIRVAVVLLLLVILLGPTLAVSVRRTVEPAILLLLDESLSMSIRDRYSDDDAAQRAARVTGRDLGSLRADPPTRAELIDRLLAADDNALIKSLAAKGRVQVMSFSDTVLLREAIGASAPSEEDLAPDAPRPLRGEPVPPLNPQGPATNLARAMRDSLASVAGTPVAAVVLVSDGQDTVADSPERVAAAFADHRVPVFSVGVGDPAEPFNLRVSELWIPEAVSLADPFEIQAQVEARGAQLAEYQVELVVRAPGDGAGGGRVLARANVTLGPDAPRQTVTFEDRPQVAGRFVYAVRVPVGDREILDADNEKTAHMEVLDRKCKALLLAGGPTWDYRMLRNMLTRDKTVDLSCWLQSMDAALPQDGDTPLKRLPDTPEALFVFDVVLIFDPDPDMLSDRWMSLLEQFVGVHGGGLIWMCGPKYSSHLLSLPRAQPMRDLLPVSFGALDALLAAPQTRWTQEWPLQIEAAGLDHPILRARPESERTRDFWKSAPGVYWCIPGATAKPAAQVLLAHSDPGLGSRQDDRLRPLPLLVLSHYGRGRTLYFGFDSTWRWRRSSESDFDRFWTQALRTAAEGRRLRGKTRGQLVTDRDRYGLGDRIGVTARLFDAQFQPLSAPVVKAVWASGREPETIDLKPVPDKPGHFAATLIARTVGLNELTVQLDDDDGSEATISRQFAVELPNVEFADPRLNVALLKLLAERSGGAYFEIDQTATLAERIPARRETIVVRGKPITLWDSGRLMLLLVALLCCEWAVRKRMRLL